MPKKSLSNFEFFVEWSKEYHVIYLPSKNFELRPRKNNHECVGIIFFTGNEDYKYLFQRRKIYPDFIKRQVIDPNEPYVLLRLVQFLQESFELYGMNLRFKVAVPASNKGVEVGKWISLIEAAQVKYTDYSKKSA